MPLDVKIACIWSRAKPFLKHNNRLGPASSPSEAKKPPQLGGFLALQEHDRCMTWVFNTRLPMFDPNFSHDLSNDGVQLMKYLWEKNP